jgi:ribosomal protein L37AE/L43A
MPTINYTETLTVVTCTCGINYAIPETLEKQLLDHRASDPGPTKSVHCPLGHVWHYTGKSEATIAREEAAEARRRERAVRDLLVQEERSHSATKGQLTKVKKRISNGVCPHCNRSFANLARHMQSKHAEECSA